MQCRNCGSEELEDSVTRSGGSSRCLGVRYSNLREWIESGRRSAHSLLQ